MQKIVFILILTYLKKKKKQKIYEIYKHTFHDAKILYTHMPFSYNLIA